MSIRAVFLPIPSCTGVLEAPGSLAEGLCCELDATQQRALVLQKVLHTSFLTDDLFDLFGLVDISITILIQVCKY